jgi:hypothetical protein
MSCQSKSQKDIKVAIDDPNNILKNKNELIGKTFSNMDYKMTIIQPDNNIDYKLVIIEPDSNVDYKIIVIDPTTGEEVVIPEKIKIEILDTVNKNQKQSELNKKLGAN